jgi:hypothetical protein
VREREHHRAAVLRGDPKPFGHAPRARHHRRIGVLRSLRIGGRAGRVEEPSHRGVSDRRGRRRRCRQRRPIALRQGAVGDEHLEAVELLGHRAGQLFVVEAAPRRGHDQQAGARLAGDEADLALTVDGQHRVLHGAEARERDDERHRLEPRRQLPRDDGPLADPEPGEAGGRAFGVGDEVREGHRAPVLVDCQPPAGRLRGAKRHQLPQVPRVEHLVHVPSAAVATSRAQR